MDSFFFLWLIIFIISLVFEIITPTALVSIWIVIGSLVSMILSIFEVSFIIQIIVCSIVTIISFFTIRPICMKYIVAKRIPTNADALIGQKGMVIKDITNNKWGEVIIKKQIWTAVSYDNKNIPKNTEIIVKSIEGVKLIVEKLE